MHFAQLRAPFFDRVYSEDQSPFAAFTLDARLQQAAWAWLHLGSYFLVGVACYLWRDRVPMTPQLKRLRGRTTAAQASPVETGTENAIEDVAALAEQMGVSTPSEMSSQIPGA